MKFRFALIASIAFTCITLAGTASAQSRSVPTFEIDAAWPKVPAKWKLGDASSIAIDAQDNRSKTSFARFTVVKQKK